MKKTSISVCFGLAIMATLSIAGSSFADSGYATELKILNQSMSDLRSAKSKLHRVARDFGGHTRRAETLVEQSMEAVDAAIQHAKHHHDDD